MARALGGGAFRPRNAAQEPTLTGVDDKSRAPGTAATARVLPPFLEGETVIKRELFARGDLPPRDNPDMTADSIGATIGRTRVVDQTRDVAPRAAIEIVPRVELENINTIVAAAPTARQAQRFSPLRLHLGDAFAGVFDHPRPIGNGCARIDAASVNRRRAVLNPARDGSAPTRGFTQFCFQVRSGAGQARSDNPVLGETRHTRRTSCAATPKQKTAASKPPRYDAALFLPLRHRQHARLGHTSLTEGAADRGQMRAF